MTPPAALQRFLSALGFGRKDRAAVLVWGTLTFASLLTALGFLGFGVYWRWFNLVSEESIRALLSWVGPAIGLLVAVASGFGYLITGRAQMGAARVARLAALTSGGAASALKLGTYVVLSLASISWVRSIPPTLALQMHAGPIPEESGWLWARRDTEEIEETVHREIRWFIGGGNRGGDLKAEIRLRPDTDFAFGRVQVVDTTAGDQVRVPPLGSSEPISIARLRATAPDRVGRLRFTIVHDFTVSAKELRPNVEVDVQIFQDGKPVASLCEALPAKFESAPPADAVPVPCSTAR